MLHLPFIQNVVLTLISSNCRCLMLLLGSSGPFIRFLLQCFNCRRKIYVQNIFTKTFEAKCFYIFIVTYTIEIKILHLCVTSQNKVESDSAMNTRVYAGVYFLSQLICTPWHFLSIPFRLWASHGQPSQEVCNIKGIFL